MIRLRGLAAAARQPHSSNSGVRVNTGPVGLGKAFIKAIGREGESSLVAEGVDERAAEHSACREPAEKQTARENGPVEQGQKKDGRS